MYFSISNASVILLGIEYSTAHPTSGFTTTQLAPNRYDVVGSFLRPERLKETQAQHAAGAIDDAALTAIEDECITKLIEKEKAAGLLFITDGEFRRGYWHLDFM